MPWIYNYQYDAWTQQDLDYFTDVAIGPRFTQDITLWGDDASSGETWAGQSQRWSTVNPVVSDTALYFMRDQVIYEGDKGYIYFETEEFADGVSQHAKYPVSSIEQTKLDLDEIFGETQSLKRVKRILPQIGGTGNVDLQRLVQ